MKRKLINYDVFKAIENNSIRQAEKELTENVDSIAKAIGRENIDLYTINENDATFTTDSGTLIHATYLVNDDSLILENIEELVVDQESQLNEGKKFLDEMVDKILEDRNDLASDAFSNYFSLPLIRSNLQEGVINEAKKGKKMPAWLLERFKGKKHKKHKKMSKREEKLGKHKNKRNKHIGSKIPAKKLVEWNNLAKNILEFVDFKENGFVNNFSVARDASGNVTSIKIPRSRLQNEAKILGFKWKTLNTEVMDQRDLSKCLGKNELWGKACADMKKFNAMSDGAKLEETIENVVAAWPHIIYLTESELANLIKDTLVSEGIRNFDDEVCQFIAEGVLRTAFDNYKDKVNGIYKLANVFESGDYDHFKLVSEALYDKLDEVRHAEETALSDLYKAVNEVASVAERHGDSTTKHEIGTILAGIENAIRTNADSVAVMEEAALLLKGTAETNLPMSGTWNVSDKVEDTITGEVPVLSKYAKEDGFPGKYASTKAPFVSDGKNYRKQGVDDLKSGYLTMNDKDVYPNVSNPYVPKAGDFKIHGEKTIDGDSDQLAHDGGNDTWPSLKNPYIPSNGMAMSDSLKLLKSSERS
jgi:hypothetical protein